MNIQRANLNNCHLAEDTVVVIDVLRAFTTAAFAFRAGAKAIILVSTIDEAFSLKEAFSNAVLVGEDHGLPIKGFDFCNSPSELLDQDFKGKLLIQRTSTGTQGVVKSKNAKRIVVTGLCNVSATVNYLKSKPIKTLTIVEAGVHTSQIGLDDIACGDLIEALLLEEAIDFEGIKQRVLNSPAAVKFKDALLPSFPLDDLMLAVEIDKFDFVMEVHRENNRAYLTRVAS